MEEEFIDWYSKTRSAILQTALADHEFRKKHKCKCKDKVDYGNGRWFCGAMIKARNKNKEIKKVWRENRKASPFIEQSEFLCKVSNTLNN